MTESKPLSWMRGKVRCYDWARIFAQDRVWITGDGRVLLIEDIADDHLQNLLPWALERAQSSWSLLEPYPERLPLIQAIRLELAKRGLR